MSPILSELSEGSYLSSEGSYFSDNMPMEEVSKYIPPSETPIISESIPESIRESEKSMRNSEPVSKKETESLPRESEISGSQGETTVSEAETVSVPLSQASTISEPIQKRSRKTVGGATILKYSPTQAFVQAYFTPIAPVRGMLLYHSVGTGKTCSAIAAATANFEPLGYTILWVTRTTLKNDIWKNMFDQVCHKGIQQRIEQGESIPDIPKRANETSFESLENSPHVL